MRYLIVSSFPSLTASPSGVSPLLVIAPIVVSQIISVWKCMDKVLLTNSIATNELCTCYYKYYTLSNMAARWVAS